MTPSTPDPLCCRLVELAARMMPADRRQRYAREFVAELYGMPRRRQLRHSGSVLVHALQLRAALHEAGPTTLTEETMITTPRRPWLCRLGLHRWTDRRNPETRERYQLCARCGAYHEKTRTPGVTKGGIF